MQTAIFKTARLQKSLLFVIFKYIFEVFVSKNSKIKKYLDIYMLFQDYTH